jgi:hypothetical protein
MRLQLIILGVLLLPACSSGGDGPVDPGDRELPSILATVQASGRARDDSVTVYLCGDTSAASCRWRTASTHGEIAFPSIEPGDYHMYLRDVAENCSVTGEWFMRVPVQDSSVHVGFTLQCRGPGTVRVSVVTSGTNQDASFSVMRSASCDDYYFPCSRYTLLPPNAVEVTTWPGTQGFLLEGVADNCAVVTPGNPATVMAIEEEVVELRFEVACQ